MLAWFGGITLDLREATLAPGARLTVNTIFGGVAIRVPPEWRLESNLPRPRRKGRDLRKRIPSRARTPEGVRFADRGLCVGFRREGRQ